VSLAAAVTPPSGSEEASAAFVRPHAPIATLASDLGRLSWRGRLRLVAEHLLPPVAWMRAKYPRWPVLLLPFAYAYRIGRGAPAWLKRGHSQLFP